MTRARPQESGLQPTMRNCSAGRLENGVITEVWVAASPSVSSCTKLDLTCRDERTRSTGSAVSGEPGEATLDATMPCASASRRVTIGAALVVGAGSAAIASAAVVAALTIQELAVGRFGLDDAIGVAAFPAPLAVLWGLGGVALIRGAWRFRVREADRRRSGQRLVLVGGLTAGLPGVLYCVAKALFLASGDARGREFLLDDLLWRLVGTVTEVEHLRRLPGGGWSPIGVVFTFPLLALAVLWDDQRRGRAMRRQAMRANLTPSGGTAHHDSR